MPHLFIQQTFTELGALFGRKMALGKKSYQRCVPIARAGCVAHAIKRFTLGLLVTGI